MTRSEFQKEVHDYSSDTWQPAWLYCQKLNEKLEGKDAVVVKFDDKYGLMVRSAAEMLGFPFVGTDNIMDAIRVFGGSNELEQLWNDVQSEFFPPVEAPTEQKELF